MGRKKLSSVPRLSLEEIRRRCSLEEILGAIEVMDDGYAAVPEETWELCRSLWQMSLCDRPMRHDRDSMCAAYRHRMHRDFGETYGEVIFNVLYNRKWRPRKD